MVRFDTNRLVRWLFVANLGSFVVGTVLAVVLAATGLLPEIPSGDAVPFDYYTLSELSFTALLRNNLSVTVVLAVFTTTGMWIGTAALLFANGFTLGVTAHAAVQSGVPPSVIVAVVIPHGVLEIVGFSLAGAVGFRVPVEIGRYLAGHRDRLVAAGTPGEVGRRLLLAGVLVVVAAAIEAFVSFRLADLLR